MGEGFGNYIYLKNFSKGFVKAYKEARKTNLEKMEEYLKEKNIDDEGYIEKAKERIKEDCIYALIKALREESYSDFDIMDHLTEEFDITKEEATKYIHNINYLEMLDKSIKEAEDGGFAIREG